MAPTEKYRFDPGIQETLERLSVPFAVYQFLDSRVVTLVLSDGFCQFFGYDDRAQACYDMDHDMYWGVHPDDAARIANEALRFAKEDGRYEVLYRTKTRDSSDYHIVHAYGKHVYTDTGVRLAHVWYADEGVYRGECGQRGFELNETLSNALHGNSIVKDSQYDYLTGLPSMSYFFELAESLKERARGKGVRPALIYLDFVGMKFFNTKYGFAEGDRLLVSFARLLSRLFGNENCCRISADHYLALCEEPDLEDRLRQLLGENRGLGEGRKLPVHIGVYVGQNEKVHVSVACDWAKMACKKLSGKYESAVNYYSRELSEDAANRQYIIENIDKAISEKWIRVYFQPIVRAVNGRVCDEEALARWIDPEKGFLSPAEFIPYLEESEEIYKLDLYVLEQVLEKIRLQHEAGLNLVPQSINLSRSDFTACDIVEEVRKRVDAAGVRHELITVEITESVIGSDFDYMKAQIARFQELGFPVWLDDFGSEYSSLEVLQAIRFDLIKFDLSFMRRLNEGNSARIVLTELMKMAASLGVITVCEGVETEEQVSFLREIGCSKLQGYYFCKPIPYEEILDRYRSGRQIGFEDPEVSDYFEAIGRINLYDLDVIASRDENLLHHSFNTIPIGIVEIKDNRIRLTRSNPSYREFLERCFGMNVRQSVEEYREFHTPVLEKIANSGMDQAKPLIYDETMQDGSVVHSFARRIGRNPKTGDVAVAVAILSVRRPDEIMTEERVFSRVKGRESL